MCRRPPLSATMSVSCIFCQSLHLLIIHVFFLPLFLPFYISGCYAPCLPQRLSLVSSVKVFTYKSFIYSFSLSLLFPLSLQVVIPLVSKDVCLPYLLPWSSPFASGLFALLIPSSKRCHHSRQGEGYKLFIVVNAIITLGPV